jgi:hypothetical protein
VRVLDEILDYPEIDHVTEQMRIHVTSRHGEQTPNIVIVQGGSKETLRLFGETYAVTRVRAALFHAAVRCRRCSPTDGLSRPLRIPPTSLYTRPATRRRNR